MAAPVAVQQVENKHIDRSLNRLCASGQDSECLTTDMETLQEHVEKFLINEVGSDLKSVKNAGDLLRNLSEENGTLEKQVLTVSSSVPLKVSAALSAAEEAGCTLTDLMQKERITWNLLNQHLQGAQPWMDNLSQMLHQVSTIERHRKYLLCLQHIEELSAAVQQCLMTSSVWEAIGAINDLAALDAGLKHSGCSHLQAFLRETLTFWHKILKDRLTSDLEKVLAHLHWPIISPPTQSLTPTINNQEIYSQLELLVTQLLALQTSDDLLFQKDSASTEPFTQPGPSTTPLSQSPPLCLPIQIMLIPLTKRFRYHFYGNRQTNSPSKPEWYLTQVLMWMSNSSAFMEEKIQPILEKAGTTISARVELCRGLLSLVQEKVASDASRLLYEDTLFCHLVEEVLLFEKELRSNQSYPAVLPGLLHLLLEDSVLQKWLTVEKKIAVEKMDAMLSAEEAWNSQYKDISDMDELKAPHCAETFMTLLQVITERYRALPCPSAQLKFLILQRELVDDFRIRLTQVMKEESRCPLSARYCAILNGVNYISTILGDWGDNVFFLQLQQAAVSLGDELLVGGLGVREIGRLASLEGSLFEVLLALLERLKGDMMGRLLEWTVREISEKAKPYSQDRWLSLPSQHDQLTMCLSSSACPMMLCVRDRLLYLHQVLSLPLFQLAWQGLADRLDNFIYQDVILSNHFSDGGAAQLHFDMTRNLFPLFGHYCKRPENFFKHVKEACIILCLNVGSAILLKKLLKGEESDTRDLATAKDPSPESALHEMGIYCLSSHDVLILLNLRASWPDLEWISKVRVNTQAVLSRAQQIQGQKSLKKQWQAAWLLKAVTCMDLTTLSGDDTLSNVHRLCLKAIQPFRNDLLKEMDMLDKGVTTAAICVYPSRVADAVTTLKAANSCLPVASVATGFPAGQTPLESRLEEVRMAVADGATEIDIVINRTLALTGQWKAMYDEICQFREACGTAHMKTILAVGELGTFTNVYKASLVAMMAGSDFIKTSTGKETVNATYPVAIVMVRAIRDYYLRTGQKVGFKPAGGIRTAQESLLWLTLMKEELGNDWLCPHLFRLGASSLLADIERQIYHQITGQYAAYHELPMA